MKPYSYDLRVRIYQYSLTHTLVETAKVFNVCIDTVVKLRKLHVETGDLKPRKHSGESSCAVSPEGEFFLRLLLKLEPDLTLEELCERYEKEFDVHVCSATMHNTLKRMNITRKKKNFSDPKKHTPENKAKKVEYDEKIAKISPENRFYLDETGACMNMTPLYGRSPQGKRVHDKRPTNPGTRINVLAILSKEGVVAQCEYSDSFNSEFFINYLEKHVLPIMNESQVLIMDNHPVHKAKLVINYLEEKNINYLFLPSYSPELNPIEEAFSKIKHFIKKQKARTKEALSDAINVAINMITLKDINGYFNHAVQF